MTSRIPLREVSVDWPPHLWSGEARVNTCLRASSVQGPWAHAGFQELCVHTLFKFVFHHIVMAAGNQPYWECLPHQNWQTPNSFFFVSSSPFSIQLFPFPLYYMLNILNIWALALDTSGKFHTWSHGPDITKMCVHKLSLVKLPSRCVCNSGGFLCR